jgi:hypothetical protein
MGLVRHFSGFFLHYYDWRDAGVNGQARGLWDGDRNNFAPRIGLACQLHRRTVVRAGYGIFFDVLGIDRYNVNQGGYSRATNVIPTTNNGQTFRVTLANAFLQIPPEASQGREAISRLVRRPVR